MPIPRAMTVKDVAYTLNISCTKVYRMAKSGELEGFKAGTKWLFDPDKINEWKRRPHYLKVGGGIIFACLCTLLS